MGGLGLPQLPYFVGGAREDRTPDLLNAIQALSHLSYDPTGLSKQHGCFASMPGVYAGAWRGARGNLHLS